MTIGSRARKPNPALAPFSVLVGRWTITAVHPLVPGKTFHGRAVFEWIEGGAFLIERSEVDEPEVPSGLAIYGSDDAEGTFFMSYFDERGVSRRYVVTMGGTVMTWRRDDPKFRQRMTFTVENGGRRIVGKGEMSREGRPWEGDLELIFERV